MERQKQNKGFRAMDPQKQRELASKGGREAHRMGTAHEWTRDEAREAGHKGGLVSARRRAERRAVAADQAAAELDPAKKAIDTVFNDCF